MVRILLVLPLAFFAVAVPAMDSVVPPTITRQSSFQIPFAVEETSSDVAEVQLHASGDRGAHWHLAARQSPATRHFQFRAPRDGEYWFATRTVDVLGQQNPATDLEPALKIIVDTTLPQLSTDARLLGGGSVQISWDVRDANVADVPVKFEFRSASHEEWQAVDFEPVQNLPPTIGPQGRNIWLPKTAARVVQVRITAIDRAGNSSSAIKQLLLPSLSNRRLTTNSAAGQLESAPANVLRSGQSASQVLPKFPRDNSRPPVDAYRTASPPPSTPISEERPTVNSSNAAVFSNRLASQVASGERQPEDAEFAAQDAGNGHSSRSPLVPRMFKDRRFALDYDVESAGPGGISRVELWVTRNGGADWSRWGTDEDLKSPIEVQLESDGYYGFRIVIVSKSGLASTTPRAGEVADVMVGVDTVAPTGQIASVSLAENEHSGTIEIRWQAADQRLAKLPIGLQYSDSLQGPWKDIGLQLPNTGVYYWSVDSQVPQRVFLRLLVRDEAGNQTEHTLPHSISLQGLTPSGKIKGLRAAPTSSAPTSTKDESDREQE